MFTTIARTKGGAVQLGAKGPGQPGPFGVRPDEDDVDGQDDGQHDHPGRSAQPASVTTPRG